MLELHIHCVIFGTLSFDQVRGHSSLTGKGGGGGVSPYWWELCIPDCLDSHSLTSAMVLDEEGYKKNAGERAGKAEGQ